MTAGHAGNPDHACRSDSPRGLRRLPVPAELARDADPDGAVPVSLIGTFVFFPVLGFSINTLSLFGLVLAIGLVVDDAIVVVEAVEHHIEEGMSPKEATLKAMHEVSGPVVSIALILASVFIPGRVDEWHSGPPEQAVRHHDRHLGDDLGLQRADAVAGFGRDAVAAAEAQARCRSGASSPCSTGGSTKATHGYIGVSRGLIRKAAVGVALLVAFAPPLLSSAGGCPTSFVPEEDYGYFTVNLQLPPAASLAAGRRGVRARSKRSCSTPRACSASTRPSASVSTTA